VLLKGAAVCDESTLTGESMPVQRLTPAPWRSQWGIPLGISDGWIPSGYVKIAIENGHRNSGFSH